MPAKIDQSNLPIIYQMVTSPKAPEGPILSEEMGVVYTANRIYNLEKKIEAARQWEEVRRQEHLQKMEAMFAPIEARLKAEEEKVRLEARRVIEEDPSVISIREQIAGMKAEFARNRENYEKCKEKQRLREEQEFSISKFVKEFFSRIFKMLESIKVFAHIIKLNR